MISRLARRHWYSSKIRKSQHVKQVKIERSNSLQLNACATANSSEVCCLFNFPSTSFRIWLAVWFVMFSVCCYDFQFYQAVSEFDWLLVIRSNFLYMVS